MSFFTLQNILFCYLFFAFTASGETPLGNRISASVNGGFGGRYHLSYERRFSHIFGLEAGAEIGEDIIKIPYIRLQHAGPFAAANLYLTAEEEKHQFYISPRIHLAFGRSMHVNDDPADDARKSEILGISALRASVFVMYRYLLPFQMTIEAGLGVDAVSMLIPFERAHALSWHSLPIPKIHLGIGYAF
jgi:hypothetical protein